MIRLGRSVSALGLGGAGLNGISGQPITDVQAVETVHAALQAGIDFIDTSAGYGESERRIGLALRGVPRDLVFIASKTGTGDGRRNYSADFTCRSVERSLKRLGTDYIDLMQIHDPDTSQEAFDLQGALGALLKLKEQGVIRGIGLGVRNHDLLLQAIHHGAFDTILTYADFNIIYQHARDNLFDAAQRHHVSIILGSPLFFGWMSDADWSQILRTRNSNGQSEDERRVLAARQWAERWGVSKVHVSLQYCLREPRISTVLIGAETPEQIRQSVQAASTPLPGIIWEALANELGVG